MINKIIEELEKLWSEYNSHNDYRDYKADAINQAIEIVKKYDNDGWISVEELPPRDTRFNNVFSINVNFVDDKGLYYCGYYDFEHEEWQYGYDDNICLHTVAWKLPQPYKGE